MEVNNILRVAEAVSASRRADWKWIHYADTRGTGISESEVGSILVRCQYSDGRSENIVLSRDAAIDGFLASYGLCHTMRGGCLKSS